jgi:hypothetical protein
VNQNTLKNRWQRGGETHPQKTSQSLQLFLALKKELSQKLEPRVDAFPFDREERAISDPTFAGEVAFWCKIRL